MSNKWYRVLLTLALFLMVVGAVIRFTEIPVEAHSPLYWYGGTGNWSSGTAHWSTNSGNVPPSTHATPTLSDSVIFDANSFTAGSQTLTIDTTAPCHDMTWTAVTNNPTLAGTSALNIYGSFAGGAFTRTFTGTISFKSTSAGETINLVQTFSGGNVYFDGVGGGWQFTGAFNIGIKVLTLTNGALDTNGHTVTSGNFDTTVGVNSLTLGASAWNITRSPDQYAWDTNALDSLTCNTSHITITNSSGTVTYVYGNTFTYYNMTLHNTSTDFSEDSNGTIYELWQVNTFNNLTLSTAAPSKHVNFLVNNNTITGTFTAQGGDATHRAKVVATSGQKTITAATVVSQYADYYGIIGAGLGDWNLSSAGEDSIDYTTNSGITFTWPNTGTEDMYWTSLYDGTGGAGYWKNEYNWSTTSGGTAGPKRWPMPTSGNNVYFDTNSGFTGGNTRISFNTEDPNMKDLDFTGCDAIAAPQWYPWNGSGTGIFSIYGDLTMPGGGDLDFFGTLPTQTWLFKGTGGGTITTNGVNFDYVNIGIDCGAGTYTLQDDLIIGMTDRGDMGYSFDWTSGTLDTNGNTIYLNGTGTQTFDGGTGKTYDSLVCNTAGTTQILTTNNFTNFTRQGSASYTDTLKFAADQYITNLDLHGNNGIYRLAFQSTVAGTQHQISVSGTVDVTNTNLSDSAKVGAGDPDITAGNNSDFGGNLGWIFDTGFNIYWVGNSGNWSDLTNHWSSTSGGTPGTSRVPLIQDIAVFDVNSFAISGRTVTIDITDISGIDASSVTNTPTITKAGTIDIYGDVNLGTVTYTVTTTNFKGLASTLESDSTLTTAFYVLKNEYFMSTLYLNSNVTVTGTVYVQSGVFNHNGWNLTATAYDSATTTYTRQIILGAGVTMLDGTGATNKWNMASTKLTLTCGESTIKLTSSAANAQTFVGQSLTYNNITVAGAGAYTLTFSGTNTAGTMTIDRSGANKIIAGNVTWTLTDDSGLVMDLAGTKTITITNTDFSMASGVVLGDYLVISGSSAAGGATFFANVGGHSTDSGGNAGWVWTPPTAPTLSTLNASDVTYLGERLNGELLTKGSYVTFYCYFEYGPTVAYGFTTVPEHTLTAVGTFNNYLSPYKTYHYRAVARFGLNDHVYGNDKQVSISGAVGQAKTAISDPGQGSGTALVSAAPVQPGNMYTEGHTDGLFGLGAIIDPALTAAEIPVAAFWYPIAFMVAILLGFLAYGWTRTIIVQAVVSAVVMAAFCGGGALGDGLLPYWTVLVFVIEAVMIVVIQEKQNA